MSAKHIYELLSLPRFTSRGALVTAVLSMALWSTPIYANDGMSVRKSNAWSTTTLTKTPGSLALEMTALDEDLTAQDKGSDVTGISPVLKSALFDLPSDTTAPLFKLDLSGSLCLDTTARCAGNDIQALDLGYELDFAKADGFKGIDLSLTPRAGVSYDEDSSSALVGALLKIGDNLAAGPNSTDSNTWYFFAGADAQALSYDENGLLNDYEGRFALQDDLIVGDAQAGLGYRLGDADLSLTYLRRQAIAEDYKFEEDAAALSLTWRR